MNVLCLGSEVIGPSLARSSSTAFLRRDLRRRRALRRAACERSKQMEKEMKHGKQSRLHELAARGQSVWFDSLSRDLVRTGELKQMMKDDAVIGVTSNPTIFQKALSEGDAYDERSEGAARGDRRPDGDLLRARAPGRPRRLRRAEAGLRRVERRRRLRLDGGRARARLRHRADVRPGALDRDRGRPAEPHRQDPGDEARPAAIEDCIAHGKSINVTLIFSLERYKAVVEAYLRGLERLVARGGDPSKVASVARFFVSRVDTEADKRLEAVGNKELQGKLAIANAKLAYEHYLEAFSGPRWEFLAGQGRHDAAVPLGVDVDEEPRLPRRDVRRGADRPGHGQHDAARDDRGVPGSRRGARRHGERGRRRGAEAARGARARSASTTTTSSRRSRPRACRSSPTRSTSSSTASAPSAQPWRLREQTSSSGSGRATRRVWTGADEAQWLGWLDEPRRMREDVDLLLQFADSVADRVDDVVLLGMGGSSLAPEVLRRTFRHETFHVLDTTHPQAIRRARGADRLSSARSSSRRRSPARRSRRARTPTTSGSAPGGNGDSVRRDHRSRLRARAARAGARLPRVFAGEPTIGGRYSALSPFGMRAGGADGHRRRAPSSNARSRWRRRAGWRGQSRARARALSSASGWQRGPRQDLHRGDAGRLRPLGRAADRRVDRQAGQGAHPGARRVARRPRPAGAARCARAPTRTSSARSSSAGSSRSRSPASILEINPFDQPDVQAAKDKTNEVLAAGPSPTSRRGARSTSCSRRRSEGDYVCVQAFVDPTAANERGSTSSPSAPRATGCVVTHGYGPRYLHSTGQLHKGGPNTGLFLQVVDDTGEELAIPGQPFGFGG